MEMEMKMKSNGKRFDKLTNDIRKCKKTTVRLKEWGSEGVCVSKANVHSIINLHFHSIIIILHVSLRSRNLHKYVRVCECECTNMCSVMCIIFHFRNWETFVKLCETNWILFDTHRTPVMCTMYIVHVTNVFCNVNTAIDLSLFLNIWTEFDFVCSDAYLFL